MKPVWKTLLLLTGEGPWAPRPRLSGARQGQARRRQRFYLGLYLFLALCLVAAFLHGLPLRGDYSIFARAGLRLRHGEAIYQDADAIFPFKYHPSLALIWAAWTLFAPTLGKVLFLCLQSAAFFLTLGYWIRRMFSPREFPAAFAFAFICGFKMLCREIDFGQVNGGLFYLATLAIAAMEGGQAILAGAVIAGLILTKLNFALLVVPLLVLAPLGIVGMIGGAAAAALATLIWFGRAGFVAVQADWLRYLFKISGTQYLDQENQGLVHFLYAMIPKSQDQSQVVTLMFALGVGAWVVFGTALLKSRRAPREYAWSWWLFGLNFLSPLAWWNQYLLALPMILLLWRDMHRWGQVAAALVVVWVLVLFQYDLLGARLYNQAMRDLWFFYGMVVLGAAFLHLLLSESYARNRHIRAFGWAHFKRRLASLGAGK